MKTQRKDPTILSPDKGQSLSVVGDTYRILVSGKETNGEFAMVEMLIPKNGGPAPHAHPDFFETFFVIDGEIELKTEHGPVNAGKGAYAVVPEGGTIHCFTNRHDKVAHLICTLVPAGLEGLFQEIGKPVEFGEFLPPTTDPEELKKFADLAKKYKQILYPQDYLD